MNARKRLASGLCAWRCSWAAPARMSRRWRQLYLRALLDAGLKANGGKPDDRCNEAFAELIRIYHAENAIPGVRPPLPKDWKPKPKDAAP